MQGTAPARDSSCSSCWDDSTKDHVVADTILRFAAADSRIAKVVVVAKDMAPDLTGDTRRSLPGREDTESHRALIAAALKARHRLVQPRPANKALAFDMATTLQGLG